MSLQTSYLSLTSSWIRLRNVCPKFWFKATNILKSFIVYVKTVNISNAKPSVPEVYKSRADCCNFPLTNVCG